MKKLSYKEFKRKIKPIKKPDNRQERFIWKDTDVEIHKPKINEKTFEKPEVDLDVHKNHLTRDHTDQFSNHHADIEYEHEQHVKKHGYDDGRSPRVSINHYKENGHETINDRLRYHPHLLDDDNKHHIKNLDHVTNHPIEHEMHVFRGIPSIHSKFHDMKPGDEFTDHGYSSTSMKHDTAHGFGEHTTYNAKTRPTKTNHVMKIHLPKGTRAHHFDAHSNANSGENEVVLHRGTRFRVSHHSVDDAGSHTVHVTAIGHHPREIT
jgi:hypothetical protein